MTSIIDYKIDERLSDGDKDFLNLNYFQDILVNNHIYHNFEIDQLYIKIKKMLVTMKLINSYIFAYATYIFLREKSEFRTLECIAHIFDIDLNFFRKVSSKIMAFLEVNENENVYMNDEYYFSLIFPFLQRHKMKKFLKKTLDLVLKIKNRFYGIRSNVIAGGCLLYVLKAEKIKNERKKYT